MDICILTSWTEITDKNIEYIWLVSTKDSLSADRLLEYLSQIVSEQAIKSTAITPAENVLDTYEIVSTDKSVGIALSIISS